MERGLGIIDIDHLMIRTRSLDHAAQAYKRLGFFVCPPRKRIEMSAFADGFRSQANAPKATLNNRHIIFKAYPGRSDVANFLEFMCIEDPLATPSKVTQLMAFLGDSEGPKTVVCLTPDINASVAEFKRRGFESPPTIPFETGWDDTERGTFVRIEARPFVPLPGQMPFQMNCYETSTIDNYQYTPWTAHPNTARYVKGVMSVTENLCSDVEFMASRILDVEPRWLDEHACVIRPRDIEWRFFSPTGFASRYPGCHYSDVRLLLATIGATVAVDSLPALKSILRANAVDHVDFGDRVCISPEVACNTLLEFVATAGEIK
ncbi:VOC family protein [Bradyrhizobium prioriisuperbiae]|uniref:VOC family protein n=1 Tax=Bradyrhizobium prioriisuperbiae TaxID=2854389 RepID=UPI0028EEF389|nr:VOC family protein [Bradyrhizobium prioritasuperba]